MIHPEQIVRSQMTGFSLRWTQACLIVVPLKLIFIWYVRFVFWNLLEVRSGIWLKLNYTRRYSLTLLDPLSFFMRDFTRDAIKLFLHELKQRDYRFQTVLDFLQNPTSKTIILRHDVDRKALCAWRMACIEAELGIKGTYYFRIFPAAYNEKIIKAIADLGHEIGYHYEDFSSVKGDWELGIRSFEKNLEKLRAISPVKTICMHGSPLSKFDNRLLWQKFDYRNYGIIGEPYFDIDFNEVLYLTDTGRRWDGDGVSIRDKASTSTEHRAWGMERNNRLPQRYAPCSMRSAFITLLI